MSVTLLPASALVTTSDLDKAAWNYRGVLGVIQRRRFELVVKALGNKTYERLLEVGYGSGVFAPELSRHCIDLYGIDVHHKTAEVAAVLRRYGVTADLRTAGVHHIPFGDAFFDAIVVVSTLEFVDQLDVACQELARVLRPDGRIVVVTPGYGRSLDAGLRVLTGERAEDTFEGRRGRIVPTLQQHFHLVARRRFPRWARPTLYTVVTLGRLGSRSDQDLAL